MMTVQDLMKELRKIVKVHPNAKDAVVWVSSDYHNVTFSIAYIGLTTKRKPARLLLED